MTLRVPRITILDRYMLAELSGPFLFGLSAFTLIFAATQLLNIGRLVSEQHAPLWAAVAVFLWELPGMVVLVIPMALLLGTLLAMQRLSGESEITAMKAGGIPLTRIVAPLIAAGVVISFVMLFLQEDVVPYAQDRVNDIEETVINHTSAFNRDLTVSAPLPGGGKQVTIATAYDPHGQALLNVTLIQYDRHEKPVLVAFADRAVFTADEWTLYDVSSYRFEPDGTVSAQPLAPSLQIALGERPADIVRRMAHDNPDEMSRAQIAAIIRSGQLTPAELSRYLSAYQEKLARPFACVVFVLIALPYGIRVVRGGGNTGLGFGLAVAIVFVYYIVATIFSYISVALPSLAAVWAWMPNLLFGAFGIVRLRRAAAV